MEKKEEKESLKQRVINKLLGIIYLSLLSVIITGLYFLWSSFLGNENWPLRYKNDLNRFFGEDNWNVESTETKTTDVFMDYVHSNNPNRHGFQKGSYKDWNICYTDEEGEESIWEISNLTLKVNHSNYSFLNSKRYSSKDAFVLEMVNIGIDMAGYKVHKEFIEPVLSRDLANDTLVNLSYSEGDAKRGAYKAFWKKPWFRANELTAKDFLTSDIYDFSLSIYITGYTYSHCSEEEQAEWLNGFKEIEQSLLEEFGEDATFDMTLDEVYSVSYVDGLKQ